MGCPARLVPELAAGASALRRALSIVPLAVAGYAIAWFLYFQPSQNVTAKPVVGVKPETPQVAAPVELPPPARPEVAEAKPAPAPAPAPAATTQAAPAAPGSRRRLLRRGH
jgi:hypothetical protein